MDRDWFRAGVAAGTAQAQLRGLIHGAGQIIERTAPVMEVVRTAMAIDPEVAAEWPQGRDPRFTVPAAAAADLVAKPGARAGMSAGHAADVLYGILSPEPYLLLVRDRDWTPAQWEAWTYATLCAQLCEGGHDASTEERVS